MLLQRVPVLRLHQEVLHHLRRAAQNQIRLGVEVS